MIYLDNAATTCPKPYPVCRAVYDAVRNNCANPGRSGHDASMKAQQTVFELRCAASDFFNMNAPERVIITKNCTEALNIAIAGLLDGGHAVCSVLEHNSVLRPLEQLRKNGRGTYSVADVSYDEVQTVNLFASLIKHDTKMIICTHVSNVFGISLPVKKLVKLAHDNGLLFILDASQSAGAYEVDMADGYDAVCLPGHKGLFGPAGTGLLLLREGIQPQPLMYGGTGSFSHERLQPSSLPDALESGTLNVPGAAGLIQGIEFVKRTGKKNILEHEKRLVRVAESEMLLMNGITVYASEYPGKTLLSFNVGSLPSELTASMLNREGFALRAGYHCAYDAHRFFGTDKGGTVRLSPGAFNSMKDIELFLKFLYKISK